MLWCSAQDAPWTWSWQPYPGVWMFIGAIAVGYSLAIRGAPSPEARGRWPSFALGLLVLWLASDWPVGPLGAGYLLSVHTAKYILYSFVVPPLVLHGLPRATLRAAFGITVIKPIARFVTKPLIAFAIFNVVMLGTHLPAVVDSFKTTQLGSFAIDIAWLFAGMVFWWQVLGPLPEFNPLGYPGRILFLILNIFIPTVPAAFLTFADYPIYALYELAPPIGAISTRSDQQIAGMIMKIAGGFIIFGAASVLFFKWYEEDSEAGGR